MIIKDVYLHFIIFTMEDRHDQFMALPFSLSTVPRVCTKMLALVPRLLRNIQSRNLLLIVQIYLESVSASSPTLADTCKWNKVGIAI